MDGSHACKREKNPYGFALSSDFHRPTKPYFRIGPSSLPLHVQLPPPGSQADRNPQGHKRDVNISFLLMYIGGTGRAGRYGHSSVLRSAAAPGWRTADRSVARIAGLASLAYPGGSSTPSADLRNTPPLASLAGGNCNGVTQLVSRTFTATMAAHQFEGAAIDRSNSSVHDMWRRSHMRGCPNYVDVQAT